MAWSERLHKFYFISVFVGLMYGFAKFFDQLWYVYQTRSLTFTVDTIYLHWNTTFPAVTVCEIFNGEKVWDLSEKYEEKGNAKLIDFISDISFFTGNCHTCATCFSENECPTNFTSILERYRSTCEDILFNCTWNGIAFDCCNAFLPMQSEFGPCFAINSGHTDPKYGLQLISNRETGPGTLRFYSNEDVTVYVHSSDDVPSINDADIKESVLYGSKKDIIFSIFEIANDAGAEEVPVEIRKCFFPWEIGEQNMYNLYSYSTCSVECGRDIHLKYCNCTHHLMPKQKGESSNICDYKGLLCLTENIYKVIQERKDCNCLPSCIEPDYTAIYTSQDSLRDGSGSVITISMHDLPKMRYYRNIVRTNLDFVISVGGVVGLFFGASIISAIEFFIYDILFRVIKFAKFLHNKFNDFHQTEIEESS